jgi:hypothetical protein
MSISMGSITTKNAEEFFMRIALVQSQYPLFYDEEQEPVMITLEDIKRRIGLWTNVSDMSFTKWMAIRAKNAAREAAYQANLARNDTSTE